MVPLPADDGPAQPTRLETLQRASFWVAVTAALLALMTSGGCGPLPAGGGTGLAWPLHPLLLALGAACGWATTRRLSEIDAARWRVVEEAGLTKGEREWAHKEAEAQRRRAGASFVAAPLLLAGWLSQQLRGAGGLLVADLLPVSAMLGFGVGAAVAAWRQRHPGPAHPGSTAPSRPPLRPGSRGCPGSPRRRRGRTAPP
ncbi:MAG TPA: hypothetical protein VMT16_03335 [Thermoanaerobaculia bacterium]|nr:hypothetical protein [Thermoanaerobaculia bacterium]